MPSSIIVNFMTTQHKVSVGITTAFPDVCKTPAPPAPSPVPIPYPNVGLSGMASIKVTKRVGDDRGQKVMLMGSSYSLTSGDEPGVALGIISNRVKGKSTTKNSSFNVKFEGKGVSRLTDPHGNNSGSTPNAFSPAEMQGPMVGIDTTALGEDQRKACDKLAEKEVPKPPETEADVALKAGMLPDDFQAYKRVCQREKVAISFRDTNPSCLKHLKNNKIGSKGHDVTSKTFEKGALPKGEKDLAGLVSKLNGKPKKLFGKDGKLTDEAKGMLPKGVDPDSIKSAKDLAYKDSKGRMLTGDYDMGDIFGDDGRKIGGGGPHAKTRENKLIDRLNREASGGKRGKQPRIKHGAQSNFDDFVHSPTGKKEMHVLKNKGKDFPSDLHQGGVKVGKRGKRFEGLTLVDGTKTPGPPPKIYRLETHEDVVNMYRCKGQELPKKWQYVDKKTKQPIKA